MVKKSLFWSKIDHVALVAQVLKRGQVVLCSSDTVLGLLAVAQESGYESLNRIKGRENKPYIVLVSSLDDVQGLVKLPLSEPVKRIMDTCWPGPVTLILPVGHDVFPWLGSGGTIAVRVPDHEGLRFLARECGLLFSTSANRAGQPVPQCVGEVDKTILDAVPYVINEGRASQGLSSTLLDCTGPSIKVLREGAFSVAELEKRAGITIAQ